MICRTWKHAQAGTEEQGLETVDVPQQPGGIGEGGYRHMLGKVKKKIVPNYTYSNTLTA